MDNSRQNPTSISNTIETALNSLLSSENQSQNSVFVFGNVYVNNQNEKSEVKKAKESTPDIELSKSFNVLNLELNNIAKEMTFMKNELKAILESKEMQKDDDDYDSVFVFGRENEDNGFNFMLNSGNPNVIP